jgi:hypothetical protein
MPRPSLVLGELDRVPAHQLHCLGVENDYVFPYGSRDKETLFLGVQLNICALLRGDDPVGSRC